MLQSLVNVDFASILVFMVLDHAACWKDLYGRAFLYNIIKLILINKNLVNL